MSKNVISILSYYSSRVVEIPYTDKDQVSPGDQVIFKDGEDKEEFGLVKAVDRPAVEPEAILLGSKILRPVTPNDVQRFDNFTEQSVNALKVCKETIEKYSLEMQVFRANYSFDGNRLLFMFTAEERVDFRELVKDLAKILQKQIYLRQIGPRDKAKMIGGYGKCGRKLCCSTFLGKLESISMDMVRVQSLESKGSSKLSGVCGKLLCCLRYEVAAYKDLRTLLPQMGDIVKLKRTAQAPASEGKVIALDILNKKAKIYFTSTEEYLVFAADDIEKVIRSDAPKSREERYTESLDNN